jgi:hypothetical protein
MKRNERLIWSTLVGLAGLMVLYVAASRLYAGNRPAAQSMSAAELATLRDFSIIQVDGDFSVNIVRGASYSVDFTSPDVAQGAFSATVRDKKLVLYGSRNAPGSRVRVVSPELTKLTADNAFEISISGFGGAHVTMKLDRIPRMTLRNNSIRYWHIDAGHLHDLKIDRASFSAGKVGLTGHATLTLID